jgi:hypothetical protein
LTAIRASVKKSNPNGALSDCKANRLERATLLILNKNIKNQTTNHAVEEDASNLIDKVKLR